jgi:hypothetical protein
MTKILSGSSVQEFMSFFTAGVGRPNRFRVQFTLPPGVNTGIGDSADYVNTSAQTGFINAAQGLYNSGRGAINVMCNQATFPQRTLLVWELNQNSAAFKTPYSLEYDPIQFSFYSDSKLNTKKYFEIWQSAVANVRNNTMNYMSEFVAPVTIYQLDTAGRDTYSCNLIDAWPITVGSTDVSMSNSNAAHNISVTMAYRSWISSSDDDYVASVNDSNGVNAAPSQNTDPTG